METSWNPAFGGLVLYLKDTFLNLEAKAPAVQRLLQVLNCMLGIRLQRCQQDCAQCLMLIVGMNLVRLGLRYSVPQGSGHSGPNLSIRRIIHVIYSFH